MKKIFFVLTLAFPLLATPPEDSELLNRFKHSIIRYYNQIHQKQTTRPLGIWYANYLATLLNSRYQNLFYEDWTGYCNEDFFKKMGNSIFQLRKGHSATEACQKLIDGVSVMDCGNVTQLVYYLAISDIVGKETFDDFVAKSAKPLYIATYTKEAPKDSLFFEFLTEATILSPSKENERPLTLCQLCYFRNYSDYLIKHPTGNAQGYNSIYLGYNTNKEQEFISFWGSGPKTENEIIALLSERFFAPQDIWDLNYLEKHPDEKKEVKYNPDHQFFDDRHIYSYTINLEAVKKLIKN